MERPRVSVGWRRAQTFVQLLMIVSDRLKASRMLQPPTTRGSRHGGYLSKLRAGVKHTAGILRIMGARTQAVAAAEDERSLAARKNVVTIIEEGDEVPMWQQGDLELATEEKMLERQKLRYDRRVLRVLQQFWEAAQRSLQSGGDAHAADLHKEGHRLMLRRIYRLMIKDFDEAACDASISEDWARDAKGAETLSRKRFCDAFFELADTWTRGISGVEYAHAMLASPPMHAPMHAPLRALRLRGPWLCRRQVRRLPGAALRCNHDARARRGRGDWRARDGDVRVEGGGRLRL